MMLAGRRRSGRPRYTEMAGDVHDPERTRRFREAALPHLDEVYTLARYLMRNAARRNETANYRLTVAVTGAAAPVAKDATVTGTKYNATATIACAGPTKRRCRSPAATARSRTG